MEASGAIGSMAGRNDIDMLTSCPDRAIAVSAPSPDPRAAKMAQH
jgi:hypothetical protein